MKQIRWFKRKFDFSNEQNIFPAILERLKGTSIILEHKISTIPEKHFRINHKDEWSILENIGHLIDLEPIWLGRMQDIIIGDEIMRPVDLENNKTNLANHNSREAKELVHEFAKIRRVLTNNLELLSEEEVFKSSLHPRLNKPMRIMDLFLFVAEHDDHHLARISEITSSLQNG